MSDEALKTRIITANGTNYIVEGDVEGNRARWEDAVLARKITLGFTITPAQALFPSTPFFIRTECIESLQGVSAEAWAWQQQAETQHYATILRDLPGEQTETLKRMAEAYERMFPGDEEP